MANVQVTCINKSTPQGGHEHITHLGAYDGSWKLTREQVIESIDSKTHTFYVTDPRNGKISYVGVVRPAGRPAYVRTHADSDWNDNLLSLPFCR